MPTKLTNLVITKVALVDEGSCSQADIKLYKRKVEGGATMVLEEVLKGLPADQQKVITDEIEKAKATLPEGAMSEEDKKKMMEQHKKEMEKAKKPKETPTPEEMLKSANIDPVLKSWMEQSMAKAKAAEQEIIKMKEAQVEAEIITKAAVLKSIPEKDEAIVPFLKSISGVSGAVDKAVEILTKVNTLVEKGAAFSELGSKGNEGASLSGSAEAWAAIEKAANEMVAKSTEGLSKQAATTIVIKNQPKLYEDYLAALRAEN